MFEPVVREEYAREGRFTFDLIDKVREQIAPDASREATANACLRYVPSPVWFLQCHMGLKASEVRRLNNPQISFFPEDPPEDRLRVRAWLIQPFGRRPRVTVPPETCGSRSPAS